MDKKFETLEQAEAHILDQDKKINSLTDELESEKAAHEITKNAKDEAEEIAADAVASANLTIGNKVKELVVTVEKKKYKIVFGVDGLTKEELAADKTKLARLVKIKSGALELLED